MSINDIERLKRLAHPGRAVRVVIDTDTFNEIDDQFALVYALLSPEAMTVEAIYAAPFQNSRASTPGEGMEMSHAEILQLLDRLGRSPEGLVYKGVTDYVGPAKLARQADAVDDLIARARASDPADPLYVVAMAAIAWLIDPGWCPTVIRPTPILTDNVTWSIDESRPMMGYVRHIHRNPIFTDFFDKLAAFARP